MKKSELSELEEIKKFLKQAAKNYDKKVYMKNDNGNYSVIRGNRNPKSKKQWRSFTDYVCSIDQDIPTTELQNERERYIA